VGKNNIKPLKQKFPHVAGIFVFIKSVIYSTPLLMTGDTGSIGFGTASPLIRSAISPCKEFVFTVKNLSNGPGRW
jgi:hypothetical protein